LHLVSELSEKSSSKSIQGTSSHEPMEVDPEAVVCLEALGVCGPNADFSEKC
jgi:hypothetical protein